MFNRDKAAQGPQSVEITLADGQTLKGKLLVPPGRTLSETLNGALAFVEFEALGGERMFLAKSSLRSVTPSNVPPAPELWAGPTQGANFDAYKVLGIPPGSTREAARDAYLRLAKTYHPDRYAATDLPREVQEYLSVMARRINAAYDVVQARAHKQEPMFTTSGRG